MEPGVDPARFRLWFDCLVTGLPNLLVVHDIAFQRNNISRFGSPFKSQDSFFKLMLKLLGYEICVWFEIEFDSSKSTKMGDSMFKPLPRGIIRPPVRPRSPAICSSPPIE